jgi:glycerate-2-kinase
MVIKNLEQLIRNGQSQTDRRARGLALKGLEAAIKAVDPKKLVNSKLMFKDPILKVDDRVFNLDRFRNIYVIGAGKASGSMAEALEALLGKRITDGIINVPRGCKHKTEIVKLNEASHPIPDESGVKGVKQMLEIAEKAGENDLIICLISGGGSSLMPLPREGVTLADKRKITEDLLKCGATIKEINTVRKHISGVKGGWLAKKAYPATVLNLILSDVLSDPVEFIASGPTVPDSTTFSDAIKILRKYGLWEKAPESIRRVLLEGERGLVPETPKPDDKAFKNVFNVVIGNCRDASLAACKALESAGLNTLLLTALLEGEARHVGTLLASIAKEVAASNNPIPKPAAIVAGGETTVTVVGKGKGGRNQEIALAGALKIGGLDGCVIASLSTDGVDGPTDAAGAIVDGKTLGRAEEAGLDAEAFLAENDSYNFFLKLGDLIFTGPTGTNVNDISITIIL